MRSSEQDFPLYMNDPFPPVDDWVGPQSVNMLRQSFLEYNQGREISEMLYELEDYMEKNHPGYDADDPNLLTRDRKSTRLNSSHSGESRMPSSA